jgi:hypothetical protein
VPTRSSASKLGVAGRPVDALARGCATRKLPSAELNDKMEEYRCELTLPTPH